MFFLMQPLEGAHNQAMHWALDDLQTMLLLVIGLWKTCGGFGNNNFKDTLIE